MKQSIQRRRRGFTLIEILIVCAIIGVLISVLMPVLGTLRERANRTKGRVEKTAIVTAIRAYRNYYGVWPGGGGAQQWTFKANNHMVLKSLRIDNTEVPPGGNPHKRPFLKMDELRWNSEDSDYTGIHPALDPWSEPYKIVIDLVEDSVKVLASNDEDY